MWFKTISCCWKTNIALWNSRLPETCVCWRFFHAFISSKFHVITQYVPHETYVHNRDQCRLRWFHFFSLHCVPWQPLINTVFCYVMLKYEVPFLLWMEWYILWVSCQSFHAILNVSGLDIKLCIWGNMLNINCSEKWCRKSSICSWRFDKLLLSILHWKRCWNAVAKTWIMIKIKYNHYFRSLTRSQQWL